MKKTTKDFIMSVRLSPYQKQELENISKALKIKNSKLIRLLIDEFINNWYEKENLPNI